MLLVLQIKIEAQSVTQPNIALYQKLHHRKIRKSHWTKKQNNTTIQNCNNEEKNLSKIKHNLIRQSLIPKYMQSIFPIKIFPHLKIFHYTASFSTAD